MSCGSPRPAAGESLERRKRLIAEENERRRGLGLHLVETWKERSAPIDPDEERRQRLREAEEEYVPSRGGRAAAPAAPSPAPAAPGGAVDPEEDRRRKLIEAQEAYKRSLGK